METPDRTLTLKQRKWLKIYLECGNATEAAMQVYDCKDRDSAKVIGSENLSKLNFNEAMEEYGLTDQKLIKKNDEGLEANRVISAVNTGKQATGATSDFIEVPDFMVRHKYLETALKLKKRLTDRLDLTTGDKPITNIIVQTYGSNDPLQLQSGKTKPTGDPRFVSSSKVPSPELAPESKKNDTGDKSTDKVGGDI